MALSATTWEVRPSGSGSSDNNGGGFVIGGSGTDRANQDASHVTLSTATLVNATTTILDVDAGDHVPVAADIGNILQIHGGTATAGLYEITASGSGQWTLDRSAGTAGQTVVGDMGGAFASPGKLVDALIDTGGHIAWIATGTYTLSTSTPGAGGPLNTASDDIDFSIRGYNTTRGDLDTQIAITNKPVIDAGGQTSVTVVSFIDSANPTKLITGVVVDGNSGASNIGFNGGNSQITQATCCHARSCPTAGFGSGTAAICCEADACGDGFQSSQQHHYCVAHDNTIEGFDVGSGGLCVSCLSYDNTGDGFNAVARSAFINCTSHSNGGDGFQAADDSTKFFNCLSTSNTGIGFNCTAGTLVQNCAYRNNTGGNISGASFEIGNTLLTVDPYLDSGALDLRPNNTAGGGAELRGSAAVLPTQTIHTDIGAVQSPKENIILSRPRHII